MVAIGETSLVHKLLAGRPGRAVADQIFFDLTGGFASVDQGVRHLMDALLPLNQAAAVDHEERLIHKAGMGRWQRDAAGDDLGVGGGQALAQLLGEEPVHADIAASIDFRDEDFSDAPVIGVIRVHGEDPGQAPQAGVGSSDLGACRT